MPGQKLEADRKLIKALTDCEPLDWVRRQNGDLVYLNSQGQKFILADAEIQKFRSATRGRGAEMSELRRSPSAISSDSTDAALARKRRTEPAEVKSKATPAKKSGLRSDTPERGAEMHELRQRQAAISTGSAPEKPIAEHIEAKTPDASPAADRSSLQEQGAETPEESQPQVDITKGVNSKVKGTD